MALCINYNNYWFKNKSVYLLVSFNNTKKKCFGGNNKTPTRKAHTHTHARTIAAIGLKLKPPYWKCCKNIHSFFSLLWSELGISILIDFLNFLWIFLGPHVQQPIMLLWEIKFWHFLCRFILLFSFYTNKSVHCRNIALHYRPFSRILKWKIIRFYKHSIFIFVESCL